MGIAFITFQFQFKCFLRLFVGNRLNEKEKEPSQAKSVKEMKAMITSGSENSWK